jgi:hypothetical protein
MAKIKMTLVWKIDKFERELGVEELTEGDEISFKVITEKGEAKKFTLKFDPAASALSVSEVTNAEFQKLKACKSASEIKCDADGKRGGAQLPPVGGRTNK